MARQLVRSPGRVPSTGSITSADLGELRVPLDELRSSALAESRVSDFHCVTTWTARRQTIPGRRLRWPYRLVVPITALVAERTLRQKPGDAA